MEKKLYFWGMKGSNYLWRMYWGALYILIMCTTAHAQSYSYNTKFTISKKNFVDSIPIEFDNDQIYLRATIRGKEYRFCLDTGSSQGIVYSSSDFPYTRKLGTITSHDANGHTSKIEVVQYPDFQIGDLVVRGYAGSYIPSSQRRTAFDAVIGFDLFNKGLTAKIDVENSVLVLTDNYKYFDFEPGYSTKYRLVRWVPNIKVGIYHYCIDEARFDTGSRRLYEMSRKSWQTFMEQFPDFQTQVEGVGYGRRSIGTFGAEKPGEVAFLWLDAVQWDFFTFHDYHTLTTQGNSRIGAGILNYGNIIINPRRKELIFQPFDGTMSCYVSNEQTDIAFLPMNGRPMVALIWEKSEQYANGLREGDVILSIDGTPILSFQQFLNYPFVNERKHRFLVRGKDGTTRMVESVR